MVANKKQKTEEGARPSTTTTSATTTTKTKGPPPPYGSRQYWEDRYRKHVGDEAMTTTTTNESSVVVVVQKDDPPPQYDDGAILFHEWYFTYEELRPLLLPIIFGGTRIDPNDVTKEEDDDNEEEDADEQKVVSDVEDVSSDEKHKDAATTTKNDYSKDGNEEDEEEGEEEEDEWVEVEDGQLSEGDEEDEEELVEREGLGKYGPVSIIEIGCGDVPLGAALAEELNDLQRQTGSPAGCVVKRIVCLDFSETVISMLQNKQQEQLKEQLQEQPPLDRRNDVQLEYVAADARTLDYADGSFQLVLEKGTLDAMLSDKETGAASSMLIVKQCARILSVGGYFVLISHLNAHAEHGRQWLNELVIPGLKGGDSQASWEIEVHGEEENTGNGKGEEEEEEEDDDDDDDNKKEKNEKDSDEDKEEEGDSTDSPGPAVYIIRKLPPKPEGNEDATVPLRLFSY